MATTTGVPPAVHLGVADIPFVDVGDGSLFRVVMVDANNALWIVENVFPTDYRVQTHRHTGPIYAYTTTGSWKYEEYDDVNGAGSFLYEPAGSQHTLVALEDETRVWFQMTGVNLNLAADGTVESVIDGPIALMGYQVMCEAAGLDSSKVFVR